MTEYRTTTPRTIAVIPCGGTKTDHAAPARDLYTSTYFRGALAAAMSDAVEADEVFILSAKHGLISLDTIVEPYDVKMGDAGSITVDEIAAQAKAFGFEDSDIYAFMPTAYFDKFDAACRTFDTYPTPVYEATSGIGDQKHVCAIACA